MLELFPPLALFALLLRIPAPAYPIRSHVTVEDRIGAQRAIEEVYWRHRIWPRENPRPKPPLDAILPEGAIRAKVEDYLRKSNALETWWKRPITGEQLQAELDRMARETHDPGILQELFDAVGRDPFLIAETLARPTLAERLIRNRYATDERFHGELRQRAEEALAACHDVSCMKKMSADYRERIAKLREDPSDDEVPLDAEQWKSHLGRLAAQFGVPRESIPTRQISGLRETSDAFVVTAVLALREDEVVSATASWPKPSFDAWWEANSRTLSTAVEDLGETFTLPEVALARCTTDTWAPTHQELPDIRSGHTAVWTGTEMIVWGGAEGPPELNTGGRYNPATDSWTATSVGPGVPVGRSDHTAVWTGTEMVVWGGRFLDAGTTRYLNSGGRYDPATDRWTATSIGANVPSSRYGHTAVWTGAEVIVWGGGPGFGSTNTGGRYDPSTDTWTPTSTGANVPTARLGHTAVWTGSVMIVWGGGPNIAVAVNTGSRYAPATDSWMPTSTGLNVPAPRLHHTAVWTDSEMIVWGGYDNTSGSYVSTGGRYDPTIDRWTATSAANVPAGRRSHTAVWTDKEMIVWGGYSYDGSEHILSTGGRYDPSTDRWSATSAGPNLPEERMGHTAVWTGTEMIVWGGGNFESPLNTGDRYDPATDSWTRTSIESSVPAGRASPSAVWTGTEMIVWGGWDPLSDLNTGGRYDPATDSWTPTSTGTNVPSPRSGAASVWTGTELIVWGGGGAPGNTGGRYDPMTDRWTPTSMGANVPAAGSGATAVWTGTEMIVWGGSSSNTGGRYNPRTDSWTATSTGTNVPIGRSFHRAVWTGNEMIVWGGLSSSHELNSGGRYDPATDSWRPTSTAASAPTARRLHTAVWTGTRMVIWGGYSYDGSSTRYFNSGRLYDPSTDLWTPTSMGPNLPAERFYHTAVWTGAEMIVWGGASLAGRLATGGRYDPIADRWTSTSTGVYVPGGRNTQAALWTGREMIVWGGSVPTSTGGLYCACPNGRLFHRDADGDGYGDPALSVPSCDGTVPAGYVTDDGDCDDVRAAVHPGATEVCNGIDDDCNGQTDEDAQGTDSDGDQVGNSCDDCRFDHDPSQSDSDHDGEGDVCDSNDGLIWEWRNNRTSVSWQTEQGPTSWNVYIGDLEVLKGMGTYTQLPGSNALADRHCGETSTLADDLGVPAAGKVSFSLVSGVTNGAEGGLGSSTSGPRPNANPCP